MQLIKNQHPFPWKGDYLLLSAPIVLVYRGRNKIKCKGSPDKQERHEPQLKI